MDKITRRNFLRNASLATAAACSPGLITAEAKAAAGPMPQDSPQSEGHLWVASNDSMEIAVNTSTGVVERLIDKTSGEDYCHQQTTAANYPEALSPRFSMGPRIAGLILIDELRNKTFSDLTDPGRVSHVHQKNENGGHSLSFEKTWPEVEFVTTETFRVLPDHIRWDVSIRKTRGPDRNVRVVQFAPLPLSNYQKPPLSKNPAEGGPLRDYHAWAPIAESPLDGEPYWPFAVQYGQSTSGAVGEENWRTNIPMMVFYSDGLNRALSFTVPIEVPAVRVRFLNNTSAESDFHWNSREYPLAQRPYFQVSHEYLSIRSNRNLETGLLISAHPARWRPALGWVYSKYREYFDPDPSFEKWDGVYSSGAPFLHNSVTPEEMQRDYTEMNSRGVRWEELHGHFPWYGLMIPPPNVKNWVCHSHPVADTTLSRSKIEDHCKLARSKGVGTFLYYNVTESEHEYAQKNFASSRAHSEAGKPIGAFRAEEYPNPRACVLMNADPSSPFGKHMAQQAKAMVESYGDAAGFFWDVYGRSYMFDFAHDDGITMVDNKPAYYPEFMYQRQMRQTVRPLLRSHNMTITCNKPTTVASCYGIDAIMAYESAPHEESPAWIAAQSFLGLNRHVMIISRAVAHDPEIGFLQCLRYGMYYWYPGPYPGQQERMSKEEIEKMHSLADKYHPFIDLFRGKKWIFHPRALDLPEYTEGNIFRLKDGRVMIAMTSIWRHLRNVTGYAENLEVTCRLEDAAKVQKAHASAIDLGESWDLDLKRSGDALTFTVPKHAKATAIVLSA